MHFSRREFLAAAGIGSASLVGTRLLTGCDGGDGGMGYDPSRPFWVQGNYAPVADEIEAFDLEVIGAIPPELNGLYVRNGANPISNYDSLHWFLGDGMLHGMRLENGAAKWYRNRFVQTAFYKAGAEGREYGDEVAQNMSNTSVVFHNGRLLSLYELGLPHEIALEDLRTLGIHDFAAATSRPLTAHPKKDPISGELHFIGASPFTPLLTYHRVSKDGAMVHSEEIDIPRPSMMHDFQLTQKYIIVMDLPLIFDWDLLQSLSALPYRWMPEVGARLGVIPRDGTAADVKWFDVDPCFSFHTVGAYDDPEQPGRIVMHTARLPEIWAEGTSEGNGKPPIPWRWTIDVDNGTVEESQLDDRSFDFGQVNPRYVTRKQRWTYGVKYTPSEQVLRARAITRYDLDSGAGTTYEFGDGLQNDEFLLVPGGADAGEAEGYLMGFVYNEATNTSELNIFDTSRFTAGPVARIKLPRRVPFGFHGTWVPDPVA